MNNAIPVFEQLNENVYQRLHQRLTTRITEQEKKLNDTMADPVRYPAALQKKTWDRTIMKPKYLFESGPIATFSREFHAWWKKHYQYPESSVKNVKVHLLPKTNRTLAHYLIRKKPPRHMLRSIQ